MISRDNRFHGHRVITRLRGDVARDPLMSLRFVHSRRSSYRMAVVVSKKVSKKAVTRNKIRRRLYEIVRQQRRFESLPVDLVFYVNDSSVADMPAGDVQDVVSRLSREALKRLSL
jgi:ribonuclease P protein component